MIYFILYMCVIHVHLHVATLPIPNAHNLVQRWYAICHLYIYCKVRHDIWNRCGFTSMHTHFNTINFINHNRFINIFLQHKTHLKLNDEKCENWWNYLMIKINVQKYFFSIIFSNLQWVCLGWTHPFGQCLFCKSFRLNKANTQMCP